MDECAICAHPQAPHEALPGVYITTDHLDPEERSSYFVCGACTHWILAAIADRIVAKSASTRDHRPEET